LIGAKPCRILHGHSPQFECLVRQRRSAQVKAPIRHIVIGLQF
jgi:hypothetical protein